MRTSQEPFTVKKKTDSPIQTDTAIRQNMAQTISPAAAKQDILPHEGSEASKKSFHTTSNTCTPHNAVHDPNRDEKQQPTERAETFAYHTASHASEASVKAAPSKDFFTGSEVHANLASEAIIHKATELPKSSDAVFRSSAFVQQRESKRASATHKRGTMHRSARIMERGLSRNQEDLESTSAGQAGRMGFTVMRKGAELAASGTVHTVHAAQFGKRLYQDVRLSKMSTKEAYHTTARYALGHFSPSNGRLKYRYASGGATRMLKNGSKNILHTASDQIEDLHLSGGDFSSDMPNQIKSAAYATTYGVRTTYQAGSAVVHILAHPVLALKAATKGLLMVFCGGAAFMFLLFILVFLLSGMLVSPATCLMADDQALSEVWLSATKLDAEFTADVRSKPQQITADEYHFYLNGTETGEEITIETDIPILLAYLNAKYGEYEAGNVLSEVTALHQSLYSVTIDVQTAYKPAPASASEMVNRPTKPFPKPSPSPSPTPQPTPEPTPVPYTICNIYVSAQSLADYIAAHADLLDSEQLDMYQALLEVGVTTLRQELGNPFPDQDWHSSISSRWGWRWHPIHQELRQHKGLDIAMPEGTPIHNVLYGVATAGYSDDYGNYVIVTSTVDPFTSVMYAHMQSALVSSGQSIGPNDLVGYVGNTGISTGPHLHIEYQKDSHLLNPYFYLTS